MKSQAMQAIVLLLLSSTAYAQTLRNCAPPICFGARGEKLPLLNEQVISLKTTTENLYHQQVFVKGTLVSIEQESQNSYGKHLRFIIALRDNHSIDSQIEISHSLNGY